MTFDLIPLSLRFTARAPIQFPQAAAANLLRGILGASLRRTSPDAYARRFAPQFAGGPSGLRDAPRPFVLRASHLDGTTVAAGESFVFGVNLFEANREAVELFVKAFEARFGPAAMEGGDVLRLPLDASDDCVQRVRVRFLTPTELKGSAKPEFGPLVARIRDRVSTLRALFGAGPLEIDFRALGDRANQIQMTRCEIEHADAERTSRASGQTHSLGGFTGIVEYAGELAEFVPYLEIARWTGVGRQTVWGKGEIAWEKI